MTPGVSPLNPAPKPRPLASLREDLELRMGAASGPQGPFWLIYDPLRHRYIQIDGATFSVLSIWRQHRTIESLSQAVSQQQGATVSPQEIAELTRFLETNQLTDNGATSSWRAQASASHGKHHSAVMWAVHNYLFLKIPLVSPEPFLRATADTVAIFYRKSIQGAILAIGLAGLYLVSREWDRFIAEARDLASLGGLAEIAVVLFLVKGLHELGHAFTAIRYGCRVPSMGIAFMMMAPLLYTDVTDAWRLQNRKQRLAIDVSGIAVEIGLACFATAAWAFLADGLPRHLAFLIATTSWVMSVAINLNPFMRFDGYYIASDLLRVENLQSRSFALGVWFLRDVLFGLRAACPEVMQANLRGTLIAYAYSIWIYRLVLFTGIAVLVYGHFFKALGVILFLFEIVYFIAKPVLGELAVWWTLRRQIVAKRRYLAPAAGLAALAALAVVPWSTQVQIPVVMEGNDPIHAYPPRAGRIASIEAAAGQRVPGGALLLKLQSPDLDHERAIALAELTAIAIRLNRGSADREDLSLRQILEGQQLALTAKLDGIAQQTRELEVRAPKAALVAEFTPGLHVGQWIGAKQQIALLDASLRAQVSGYLTEDDLWRVQLGSKGRFIPDNPLGKTVGVTLTELAATSVAQLDLIDLASTNGGRIEVHPDGRQKLVPLSAQFKVGMSVDDRVAPPPVRIRGAVILDAKAESWLAGAWRRVLKILVRESSV